MESITYTEPNGAKGDHSQDIQPDSLQPLAERRPLIMITQLALSHASCRVTMAGLLMRMRCRRRRRRRRRRSRRTRCRVLRVLTAGKARKETHRCGSVWSINDEGKFG